MSWIASRGGSRDWIGLFRVGAADCDHGWSDYTRGETSGTFTLPAPTQSGHTNFAIFLTTAVTLPLEAAP